LCGRCAETMSLELEPIDGLRLVPVEVETPEIPGATSNTCKSPQAHNC